MKCFSPRRSILALAIGGLVFSSVACDNMQTDQRKADIQVADKIKSAGKDRRTPTTQSLDAAIKDLTAAASLQSSPDSRIRANSSLAQAEFEAGDRIVRELSALDPQISQTMWEIAQGAAQIQKFNDSAKALEQTNPQGTLKAIADKRGEMATASAAAGTKAGELQGQIDKVKGQLAQMTQQKDALVAEADASADKASKAEAKEALALQDQSTEARRKAGNLGHDIDKLSATLLPLERDLAVEQAKKKTADDAVAALDAQKKTVEDNWAARQAQMQQQKGLVTKLGDELTAKAKALDDLMKQAAELRGRAIAQFEKSAKHNATAANDAKSLGLQIGTWGNDERFTNAPERKAWEQLKNVYSQHVFKVGEADANYAIGTLLSNHAAQLEAKQKLVAGITKPLLDAGVALPTTIATADDPAKVAGEATAAYVDAADKYLGVYSGAARELKDMKDAAQVAQILSLYSQVFSVPGDGPGPNDARKAKLKAAHDAFQEAFGQRKDDPAVKLFPDKLVKGPQA